MPFDEGLTLARRPEGEERIRGARVDALFAQFRSGHSPLGSQPFFERPALSGVAGTQFAPQLLSTVTAQLRQLRTVRGERLAFGLALGAVPSALRLIALTSPLLCLPAIFVPPPLSGVGAKLVFVIAVASRLSRMWRRLAGSIHTSGGNPLSIGVTGIGCPQRPRRWRTSVAVIDGRVDGPAVGHCRLSGIPADQQGGHVAQRGGADLVVCDTRYRCETAVSPHERVDGIEQRRLVKHRSDEPRPTLSRDRARRPGDLAVSQRRLILPPQSIPHRVYGGAERLRELRDQPPQSRHAFPGGQQRHDEPQPLRQTAVLSRDEGESLERGHCIAHPDIEDGAISGRRIQVRSERRLVDETTAIVGGMRL